jgi:hypothetical protein
MTAGAPLKNKNAEKWTIDQATDIMNKAVAMSKDLAYDFIGEIARDLNIYRELLDYFAEKYPSLENHLTLIKNNLEANCFSNSKKGKIREATAIVNLKSNYHWKDRVEQEISGSNIQINVIPATKD